MTRVQNNSSAALIILGLSNFISIKMLQSNLHLYTENISTVFSTAFGSVTFATAILLYILRPTIAIDLILYSLMSVNIVCTAICDDHTAKLQWHT